MAEEMGERREQSSPGPPNPCFSGLSEKEGVVSRPRCGYVAWRRDAVLLGLRVRKDPRQLAPGARCSEVRRKRKLV